MKFSIRLLDDLHQRKDFQCGESSLDRYICQYAKQDNKRRVSRVFVASPESSPEAVAGYYTLSAGSLDTSAMPDDRKRKLPKYPVPVATLGRLAIAEHHQGQGLGSMLLADALKRVHQASLVMAVYALLVDALHDKAANYYRQFGFIALPKQPLKLFLPLDTVAESNFQ